MNSPDYKTGKLTYSMNCDLPSGKIRLNHFFAKSYIDVINGDKKIQLYKDSIYGYKDCKQMDFRFYKEYDHEFQIAENKAMVIYICDIHVASSSGKSATLVTINNLKKAFPDNMKFHDKLDLEFPSSKDISTYDDLHKMYKVNYLLSQSNTN